VLVIKPQLAIAGLRLHASMMSICYVSLTGFFKEVKEPIIGSQKSKMAEIRHLENRHDVIFFCGPILIKFRRLVQNDMSTAMMRGNGNQM